MSNRLLKINDVENLIGFKKSFIYKAITDGTFPAPLKVNRSSRWKEGDIINWMENLGSPDSGNQSKAESQGAAA